MKYKVGDKVKVRSDLVVGSKYGYGAYFTEPMAELRGKTVTITSTDSISYHVDPLWEHWTDDMFEGLAKEDGKMYASELMELARKEPEKYEGKRYRVVEGSRMYNCATNIKPYTECIIKYGKLHSEGFAMMVFSDTILKEIPPEPNPVPFMEAREAFENGKVVTAKFPDFNSGKMLTVKYWKDSDGTNNSDPAECDLSFYIIRTAEWFIEE